MPPITFITGNPEKTAIAEHVCKEFGIALEIVKLDIDEIQGEDPKAIITAKAHAAYEEYGKPVVVSDDSWDIPALNGFPGPYMKSMNTWFSAEDFLRLMHSITDRRAIINQHLAYYDGQEVVIFSHDLPGIVLNKPQGTNKRSPFMEIASLDQDNGLSIAEVFEKGTEFVAKRYEKQPEAWHALADWYKEKFS